MKEILELLGIDDRIQELCLGNISVFTEYSGWEYYGLNEINLRSLINISVQMNLIKLGLS